MLSSASIRLCDGNKGDEEGGILRWKSGPSSVRNQPRSNGILSLWGRAFSPRWCYISEIRGRQIVKAPPHQPQPPQVNCFQEAIKKTLPSQEPNLQQDLANERNRKCERETKRETCTGNKDGRTSPCKADFTSKTRNGKERSYLYFRLFIVRILPLAGARFEALIKLEKRCFISPQISLSHGFQEFFFSDCGERKCIQAKENQNRDGKRLLGFWSFKRIGLQTDASLLRGPEGKLKTSEIR